MYKTIGILGGMGPAATCDLMDKIIRLTCAQDDQHHIHICVDSNTNIPDRTKAILNNGDSPVPELIKSAIRLQAIGADFLIMPCNTAHYFYKDIVPYLEIPMLNMPEETAAYMARRHIKKAGLLATDGTIGSNIYADALDKWGITPVYPTSHDQTVVMSLIYDYIKRGITNKDLLPVESMKQVVNSLLEQGAETIILACTELPIAFRIMELDCSTIDPTLILAGAAIHYAGAKSICDK